MRNLVKRWMEEAKSSHQNGARQPQTAGDPKDGNQGGGPAKPIRTEIKLISISIRRQEGSVDLLGGVPQFRLLHLRVLIGLSTLNYWCIEGWGSEDSECWHRLYRPRLFE